MSQSHTKTPRNADRTAEDNRSDDLRASPMMDHLLDALHKGTATGLSGRLTLVMIARHFLDEEELVDLLAKQPGQDEDKARVLVLQVKVKGYSPPKRERILA